MKKTRLLVYAAFLTALGTVTSHLVSIPIGFTKVFPMQHFINVLSGILLGPFYAVMQALTTSILRNMLGTGTIFAFPGSIIGAFLAAILYQKTKKVGFAFIGELVGTGILGAIASYPIAIFLLGKEAALFGFVPAFFLSSFVGSIAAAVLAKWMLSRTKMNEISYDQNR